MTIQTSIRVPSKIFIKKYQGFRFQIAEVPKVTLTLDFELTKQGKMKAVRILPNPDLNSDVLDDIQPLNQYRFPRRIITVNPSPGSRRVSAYLLSTNNYTIETEIQFRYRWTKKVCRKRTPDDAQRPWAKCLYQYRARHVITYKIKIDREMEKFTMPNGWSYDSVVADPRKWQHQRSEGAWTKKFSILKPQFAAAPCVDPGADARYSSFETVGKTQKIKIYEIDH